MKPPRKIHPRSRKQERGVTLLLVAVIMVVVLAMAALAIDISTLYVARSESLRAAEAAAVAGAKALVAAGVTGDPNNSSGSWQTACTLATQQAQSVAAQNKIAGVSLSAAQVTVTFPNAPSADCSGTNLNFGVNPQVKVSVQRTDLPIFFARIWRRTPASLSAAATAEAFNPSNSSSVTGGQGVPVAPRCVKPWIIPNCDPGHATPANNPLCPAGVASLIDPNSGAISNPGPNTAGGVIGEAITLQDDCSNNQSGCAWADLNPPQTPGPGVYVVASMPPPPSGALPSCVGSSSYEQNIEACNPTPFSCVSVPAPGGNATVDFTNNTHQDTKSGIECLTHQPGPDILASALPLQIQAGANNPLLGSTVRTGDDISTSDSIITIPIYDGLAVPSTGQVNIIGFMQAFIDAGGIPGNGRIPIKVLNIAGCGSNSGTTPVVGGGISPIPVRLIHQ